MRAPLEVQVAALRPAPGRIGSDRRTVRLSGTLSAYLARQVTLGIGVALFGLALVAVVVDTVELLRRSSGYPDVTIGTVFLMAGLHLPFLVQKLIPFAVLPIFLSLERIPKALRHASADLGASNAQTFWRVTVPLSLPGTLSAMSFVFVLAIGDFLTPQMVGGQSGFTFGRIIYSQFGTAFNWPFGAALSVILAAVVIIAIRLGGRVESSRGRIQ